MPKPSQQIRLNSSENKKPGPEMCAVPDCENPRYKGSIKCSSHQDICPRCLKREITTSMGYCDRCREEISSKFKYIPSESGAEN